MNIFSRDPWKAVKFHGSFYNFEMMCCYGRHNAHFKQISLSQKHQGIYPKSSFPLSICKLSPFFNSKSLRSTPKFRNLVDRIAYTADTVKNRRFSAASLQRKIRLELLLYHTHLNIRDYLRNNILKNTYTSLFIYLHFHIQIRELCVHVYITTSFVLLWYCSVLPIYSFLFDNPLKTEQRNSKSIEVGNMLMYRPLFLCRLSSSCVQSYFFPLGAETISLSFAPQPHSVLLRCQELSISHSKNFNTIISSSFFRNAQNHIPTVNAGS